MSPGRTGADDGCDTGRMPVLEPNPQGSQKKLLLVLGLMLGVTVVVGIIASFAAP
ncbi:hypothetical protein GCM10010211_68670 [Streptomyces albospinus]|uniref:Uncharacterized protein n=1 Tax=Streptomyces albospinus TaxID=285515 RepID=A0ABQ2VLT6_9ACTN|nr:hypothetical protein GCM10010211_68670 [Streptomyces albospinus]